MTIADPFAPAPMHPVAEQMNNVAKYLRSIFFERNSAIEAMMLAVMSKQHMFMLGPPGTAKSDLVREFIGCIGGDYTYFEQLLSRTRADSAVLGPYNLPALRDKGDFRRRTTGFMPEANFTFLDEVGKMSPTLGHDLLAIANERIFHEVTEDGKSTRRVPLYTLFTGSNELIANESDDAAALWDRLLIRVVVDYISESSNFAKFLLNRREDVERPTIDFADLADAIDNVVPQIPVPQDVALAIIRLRDELRAKEIVPSDRRWGQCLRVLRANAFLNGQETVSEDDVQVLRYCLWDVHTQIKDVERITGKVANPMNEKIQQALDSAEDIRKKIESMATEADTAKGSYGAEANGKLRVIQNELKALHDEAVQQGRSVVKILEAKERVSDINDMCYVQLLNMSEENVKNSRRHKGE